MNDIDKQTAQQLLNLCKGEILDTLRCANAVLVDVEWNENGGTQGVLNNNDIESSFGILDYTSRRRQNLRFLLKEGIWD